MFSEPLTTTTRGEDVFRTLENFFANKELEWTKLEFVVGSERSLPTPHSPTA